MPAAINSVTRFGYDSQGRLSTVTDALGGLTLYTYDETGNKLSQTDALGRTTSWSYDALGRVLSRTLPLGQSESFSYDANGNRLSQTDFKGQTLQFAYDPNNQLIRKTLPSGQVSYTYSASGQPETITDARGTTRYAYDQRGQLLQLTQPNGLTLAYAYDAVGNRTAVTTPSGTTQFVYDDLNRLDQVMDAQGGITWYSYDILGRRTSVLYPNATRANYSYDALNRLTQLENLDATGQIISSHAYILGPTGQRLKISEANGRVVDYQYDPLYRLTQEKITDTAAGSETLDFGYDAAGNRLSDSRNGVVTPASYDDNDRLLTQGDITYSYDDNGNTLSKIGLEGTVQYGYDVENRLISVTSGGSTLHYAYDDSGIRVQARVDGAITDYLVDHNRDYAQVLEERDGAGNAAVQYLYGDDLISQDRAGQRSYYHYDGLGSTQALSDQAGLLANAYHYRAFGELAHSSGTIANNYLFAGEQFEPKSGLYYLRNRWMGPLEGRFRGMDSWEGELQKPITSNKYLYADANPVNYTDPSGNQTLGDVLTGLNVGSIQGSVNAAVFRRYIQRAVTQILRDELSAIKEIKKCLRSRKSCDIDAPVLFVGNDYPAMAEHINDAQMGNGSGNGLITVPTGFSFAYDRKNHTQSSRRWYRNKKGCTKAEKVIAQNKYPGQKLDCDEFPMISTDRGGPTYWNQGRVSLRWVPKDQNDYIGNTLWYKRLVVPSNMIGKPNKKALIFASPWFTRSGVLPH